MRNGPDTSPVLSLPLNSDVLTWREKAEDGRSGWTGPYKLVAIRGHDCVVQRANGQRSTHRSTAVRPYYIEGSRTNPPSSVEPITDRLPSNPISANPTHNRERAEDTQGDTIVVEVPSEDTKDQDQGDILEFQPSISITPASRIANATPAVQPGISDILAFRPAFLKTRHFDLAFRMIERMLNPQNRERKRILLEGLQEHVGCLIAASIIPTTSLRPRMLISMSYLRF